jgi:hypothetical protein
MHTLRLCETCAYHYNLRCRQKPFFEAWVFEVDKGRKRDRIKAGMAARRDMRAEFDPRAW